MEQKLKVVWTWCPRCMVRTEHILIERHYQCMACGCAHLGRTIFARRM